MLKCAIHYCDRYVISFTGEVFHKSQTINIGSAPRCEIRLDMPEAPDILLTLSRSGDDVVAIAGSYNIEINDKETTEVKLTPGMIFKLGEFTFFFFGELSISPYCCMWQAADKSYQTAPLSNGINLIGTEDSCNCRIDSSDFPKVCFKCEIIDDEIKLTPVSSDCDLLVNNKKQISSIKVYPGELFKSNAVKFMIIPEKVVSERLKSKEPFYPELPGLKKVAFGTVLFLLLSICCYIGLKPDIKPGKVFRSVNSLPTYTSASAKEFESTLQAMWIKMLKKHQYNAVIADMEYYIELGNLPENISKKFKQKLKQVEKDKECFRLLRYNSNMQEVYSIRKFSENNPQLFSESYISNAQILEFFWQSTLKNINDTVKERKKLGNTEDSFVLKDCVKLQQDVEKLCNFYSVCIALSKYIMKEQYDKARTICSQSDFIASLRLWKQYPVFERQMRLINAMTELDNELSSPEFSAEKITTVNKHQKELANRIKEEKFWLPIFNPEKLIRKLSDTSNSVDSFIQAEKALKYHQKTNNWNSLDSARFMFGKLTLMPIYKNNKYVLRTAKQLSDTILSMAGNSSLGYYARGKLLLTEKSVNADANQQKVIEELLLDLEQQSNTLCDKLYSQWRIARGNEKENLKNKIRENAFPGGNYIQWLQR